MLSHRVFIALLGVGMLSADVRAQGVLGGTVLAADSGQPIACLGVVLLSAENDLIARTRTRNDGTFDLPSPAVSGLYRIAFVGLGLDMIESDTLRLDATTDIEVPFRLALTWVRRAFAGVPGAYLGIDVAPRATAGHGTLKYPAELVADSLDGRVVMGYAVGTNGRIDARTALVLQSSHPGFATTVRSAVGAMRYSPAQYSGAPQCVFVIEEYNFAGPRRR